ncbi:MAG TPA: hypothetical protein PK737_02965 [Bacilli bacterium]|nr:hypothetical protein [Bacilli bacterium]
MNGTKTKTYREMGIDILTYLMMTEHYQYYIKDNETRQEYAQRSSRDFPKFDVIDPVGATKTNDLENLSNGQSTLTISTSKTDLHNASYIGPDFSNIIAFEENNPTLDYRSVISTDGGVTTFLAASPNGMVIMIYYGTINNYQSTILSPIDVAQKSESFDRIFEKVKAHGSEGINITDFENWDVDHNRTVTQEEALAIWTQLSAKLKPMQKNR